MLGPYKVNQVYTGDAKILSREIPDNSVNLVLTDPIYNRIEDYEWLSGECSRILKPNGHLLACIGIGYLRESINALDMFLFYRWQFGAFQPNGPSRRFGPKGFSKWWSLLWYSKKVNSWPPNHFPDMIQSIGYSKGFGNHKWRKNPQPFLSWLRGFTNENDLVVDFFCGEGTVPSCCFMLNRNYLAFEINPETAELARQRIVQTQPPLPMEIPEQIGMEI